jgi:hypothetical protein
MRFNLLAFASSLLLISNSSQGIPQSPSSTTSSSQTAQRDPQAIAALQQAIAALGGQAAINSLQNSVAIGAITPASAANWIEPGNFKWEDDFSGGSYEFRDELVANGITKVYASGHGHPAFNNGLQNLARSSYTSMANPPFHLPGVLLLRELGNSLCAIQFIETTTVVGSSVVHVRTTIVGDAVQTTLSQQDWYLDTVSGLPLRVVYRVPSNGNALEYDVTTTDFSNYRAVSGIAVPFTMVTSLGGTNLCTATISSISFNVPLSSSDFDLTVGGAS